jgi:uncharacterized protein YwqG
MFEKLRQFFARKLSVVPFIEFPDTPPEEGVVDALLALGKPGIIYRETDQATNSFTGGSPNLGSEFAWPEKNGRPLEFIGQLDLGAIAELLPDSPLPTTGTLSFFYEHSEDGPWGIYPEDAGSWKVVYSEVHQETPSPIAAFTRIHLTPEKVSTYPGYENRAAAHIKNLDSLLAEWGDHIPLYEDAAAQALGFAHSIQADTMDEECAMISAGVYDDEPDVFTSPKTAAARASASDWVFLAQFKSRESQEICFGDCGFIYFWIRKQDLEMLNFDKAWMILQSL